MDRIYIYEGFFYKGEKGDPLIEKAAMMYFDELGRDRAAENVKIIRPAGEKPHLKNRQAEFSLSHSGSLWMCLFSGGPCGLDVQEVRICDFEGISKRLFTGKEERYVDLWGIHGFFDIWVRREAFCKCRGMGIYSQTPSFVSEKTDLLEQVKFGDTVYYLKDIYISEDIKCAVCGKKKINPEMRLL